MIRRLGKYQTPTASLSDDWMSYTCRLRGGRFID
jgi:hypothetical protein